jgi:hypothetical protein
LVEQTVIVKEFTAQWFRPEIDLSELAKLREDGMGGQKNSRP